MAHYLREMLNLETTEWKIYYLILGDGNVYFFPDKYSKVEFDDTKELIKTYIKDQFNNERLLDIIPYDKVMQAHFDKPYVNH